MKDYKLIEFVKSPVRHKKYRAILRGQGKKIPIDFGDTRYQHYKDTTGLGLYDDKNHLDLKRRQSFRARHKGFLRKGYYSAGWFSYNYLW